MIKCSYRYVTPALKGHWRITREEALSDALMAGQAFVRHDEIVLFEFARLEIQPGHFSRTSAHLLRSGLDGLSQKL